MREKLRADLEIRENSNTPDELPQIRVSMDECGIAAGAKAVLATFVEELAARRIRGIVTQTGCAGHCKDEPTVEITLPGRRRYACSIRSPVSEKSSVRTSSDRPLFCSVCSEAAISRLP